MVMAPTAISPPYFRREELKHTLIRLSVLCMMKELVPRAMQGSTTEGETPIFFTLSFSMVFFPERKNTHQRADTPWLSMVAKAAPFTPMPKRKMNIGSRIMFSTAPMRTVSMLILVLPWAVMNALRPSVNWTHMVPQA